MFKVFLRGLVFGLGLAVALGASFGIYRIVSSFTLNPTQIEAAEASPEWEPELPERQFSEISVEERIARSSVVFVARLEEASDGKRRALISEILKKDQDVLFPFVVGDEYYRASIYAKPGADYGTGVVVFLTGKNASFQESVSLRTDRVFGLGGMPLDVLRKKCASDA